MIPGMTEGRVENIASNVLEVCQEIAMDDFNYSSYDLGDDMLSLHDRGVSASDVYVLAQFALETLRNRK